MHTQITSLANIKEAYLDLYYSLAEKSKINKYKVFDGKTIGDAEVFSEEMIKKIQSELLNKTKLQPARYAELPKKGGGIRGVYMIPIKERVKCQAIFRVLEPYFEERYSDCLYSFRSTKPSYYAARSVRRLYLRNYKKKDLYVLKLDIHKYSDFHNHDFLLNVFRNHKIEDDVIDLIKLYLKQPYIHNGDLKSLATGTMQGIPLCSIFNNIYIGHIDKYVEKNAHFYRRIGDDLIIIDNDKKKLIEIYDHIKKDVEKAKLIIKDEKTIFRHIDEGFNFLGYLFEDGKISLPEKSFRRILDNWKKKLKFKEHLTEERRIQNLKTFFHNKDDVDQARKRENFLDIVRSYNLITDTTQIKALSSKFVDVLTVYFMGGINSKKISKTKKIIKEHKFPSLTKIHYWYSNGKLKKYKTVKKSVDKLIKSEGIYS